MRHRGRRLERRLSQQGREQQADARVEFARGGGVAGQVAQQGVLEHAVEQGVGDGRA